MSALSLLGVALATALPIGLDDVIRSVEAHPRAVMATQKVREAEAKRLQARGAFDLELSSSVGAAPLGKYRRFSAGGGLEQSLPLVGRPRLSTSWRVGRDHPAYDGKRVTSAFGEVGAGLRLDLWRDLFIDEDRAALALAELGEVSAEADREAELLQLRAEAAAAYWRWVAAGQRLTIEQHLAEIAEVRQTGIAAQVERGGLADIAVDDNRRLILSRRERVAAAELALEQARNQLSLYLREPDGDPVRPSLAALPSSFPAPSTLRPMALEEALAALVVRRPELAVYGAERRQLETLLQLARNDGAPRVQLDVGVYQDIGEPLSYGNDRTSNAAEVLGQLTMSLPLQRREAEGKQRAARAALASLAAEQRLFTDSVEAEVRTAFAALTTAAVRAALAEEAVTAARRLEKAELRRFETGLSDLLLLNLREQATADEERNLVDARLALQVALADFLTTSGRSPLDEESVLAGSPS